MKWLRRFPLLSTRMVLTILIGIVLIHLVVFAIYTTDQRTRQYKQKRTAVIQKVINVMHIVHSASAKELDSAVAAIDEPALVVNLTATPQFDTQFEDYKFWHMTQAIQQGSSQGGLSIDVSKQQWLNIAYTITPPAWTPQLFLFFAELLAAAIIIFYIVSINRFTRPLNEMRAAADRLGLELEAEALSEQGPAVVRQTIQAMNKMQQRIKDLLNDRTQVLAAISHDLRTPITRLKLRLQLLSDEAYAEKSMADLDQMSHMIDEILAFARGEAHQGVPTKLDLVSMLTVLADEMVDMGRDVSFVTDLSKFAYVGRSIALKRCFTNLIDNAVKYGKRARIVLKSVHGHAVIYIDDDGPGINESSMKDVFAPFFRCDKSRSGPTEGTGLGLSLADDIVRSHRGKILLANREEGGLRVKVVL